MAEPILINGRFLTQPLSGVQRYAREIVRALDRLPHADLRYRLMVPDGADVLALDRIPTSRLSGAGGHLWEQVRLADAARSHRLLSLCGAGPVGHSRQLVVIHDAAVFRRPDLFKPRYALAHRILDRRLARRAVVGPASPVRWRKSVTRVKSRACGWLTVPTGRPSRTSTARCANRTLR